jgi:hypothetical protein
MCALADTAICICVQREVNIAVQKEEGVVMSRYVCWYLIFAKRSGFSLRLTWRWATPSMWLLSSQILHVRFQPDKERLVGLCALLQYDRSFCLMEKANWMQSYVRKAFLFCTNTLGSCVPCASPSKHAGLGRLRFYGRNNYSLLFLYSYIHFSLHANANCSISQIAHILTNACLNQMLGIISKS